MGCVPVEATSELRLWPSSGCEIFVFIYAATTETYTLSLHDALPIYGEPDYLDAVVKEVLRVRPARLLDEDRKSTRLNSSHSSISYAVFCLKKKNNDADRQKTPLRFQPQ